MVRLPTVVADRVRRATSRFRRPYQRLTDGEFIQTIIAPMSITPVLPEDMEFWHATLNENPANRLRVAKLLMDRLVWQKTHGRRKVASSQFCWLMGTDKVLDATAWSDRVRSLGLAPAAGDTKEPDRNPRFAHRGRYDVSVIASLYKGGRHIRQFLRNITSQTFFDRSELIIVDANSPEAEKEVIAEFMGTYPNIVYHRASSRIGIYEAWNIGVELARGEYLTNANLDDLRRADSLELQATVLDRHAFVDVVYQDVLYGMDDLLPYESVAACGFASRLPIVTVNNLIAFNSPHNAPMWRKQLHDEVGYFDPMLRSAGDQDFWLRCIARNKTFFKINTPHVVYFHNPHGISTGSESLGLAEGPQIQRRYAQSLTSPYLLSSKRSFLASVCKSTKKITDNRFLAVHEELLATARLYDGVRKEGAAEPSLAKHSRIMIDGVLFDSADVVARDQFERLVATLLETAAISVVLLDRGGCPDDTRCERIEFPSYTFTNTAADSLLLEKFCREYEADVFLSSFYTTPLSVPCVLIVGGEVVPPTPALQARAALEKALGIAFAARYLCLEEATPPALRTSGSPIDPRHVLTLKNAKAADCSAFILEAARDRKDPRLAAFFAEWSRLRSIQAEVDTLQIYPDWDAYFAKMPGA